MEVVFINLVKMIKINKIVDYFDIVFDIKRIKSLLM